jgi:DNA-binding winged helix-turn-helix (wHTH) protein/TolB-like protein/Tfp pilus assembly protein PilF
VAPDVIAMARTFEFGPFRLDERERTLERDGAAVNLTPKTFDVLVVLLTSRNALVEKSRLLQTAWGDVHVDDAVLTRAISDLRKALGQTEDQVWIETVPKFGYRFVAEIREIGNGEAAAAGKQWPRTTGLAAVALAGALVAVMIGWGTAGSGPRIHRLVVLPFQTLDEATGEDTLGVGLADALITRLSNLEGLIVRPLSTVRQFEHDAADPLRAAEELRADAVLEGTLQFNDGSVRADIRLIRASDGTALWSDTVEARENRLFALEDALAEQVAAKLAVRLNEEERRQLALRPELNPDAYRLYADGRYEWGKRTLEGFEKAAEDFRQAIGRDPSYARAYAGLADCYLLLGAFGYYPQLEMLPKAKATALRALELDAHLAEAHATLGLITQNLDWDWKEVERQYSEAIRMAPSYATAHHWYAEFLSILGRFDESRKEFARAREIDPLSPIIQADEAQLYFFERRYDRNLELLRQVAREDPSFLLAHERLAFTYMIEGREEDAWREAMSLPDCASASGDCRRMWKAWLPHRDPTAARAALAQLEADATAGRVPAYAAMLGNIRQAHIDRALDWLERMLDTHGVWLITAKVNPIFDPLRSQPRAKAVSAKLHLE